MSSASSSAPVEIVQVGDPILRQRAREIDTTELSSPDVQALIDVMIDTVHGVGVGLAAPQIGVGKRIIVVEDPAKFHTNIEPRRLAERERVPIELYVLVNPVLETIDADERRFFEGCLSAAGLAAVVPRVRGVRARGLDRNGGPVDFEAMGWHARILQHEVDHLDGALYVDRMNSRTLATLANVQARWSDIDVDETERLLRGVTEKVDSTSRSPK